MGDGCDFARWEEDQKRDQSKQLRVECALCGNAGITEEQYAAAIPKCCQMQTMQEHMDMLLCWGLAAALRRGETMNCDGCEMKIAA